MTALMVAFVVLCALFALGAIVMVVLSIMNRELWSAWIAASVGLIAVVAFAQGVAGQACTGLLTPLLLISVSAALVVSTVRSLRT